MKSVEDMEQEALFQWIWIMPEIKDLAYAIPNGGHRHIAVAAKLKRQGVRSGVSDIHIPLPRGVFHGLWIEMKAPKPNRASVSKSQTEWIHRMRSNGFVAEVCYGWLDARNVILEYLKL